MKTNFIYALRNIRKNLTNSIITIVGLAVAIACCLLIYFYVSQEYSFNSFHENKDRIYRLNYNRKNVNEDPIMETRFNPKIVDLIKEKVPQVEKCSEYVHSWEQVMEFREIFYDIEMSYCHKDFFSIFTHPFIAGDKETVFDNPDEIILTKEFAERLIDKNSTDFSSLLEQTISFPLVYEGRVFKITGIIDDIPRNSGMQFQGIIPAKNGRDFGCCNNGYGYASIYYLLRKNVNVPEAEQTIFNIVMDFYDDKIKDDQADNILVKSNNAFVPLSMPLKNVYFENEVSNCYEATGDKKNMVILITIVLTILLIACSNYSILNLGQYMKKIGDIGIRKYMGAQKKHVFLLFFTEGAILTLVAFFLGVLLTLYIIPVFGKLSQTEIFTELINFRQALTFSAISFFTIVLLTSIIPVFFFSNVNPKQISAKKTNLGRRSSLSHIFIAFQYCTSIILIIVTLFIVKQAKFLKEKSLGIDTSYIIDINNERLHDDEKIIFRDMLKDHPGVVNISLASRDFMNGSSDSFVDKGDGEKITSYVFKVDHQYLPTLGLKLLRGKNFTESNLRNNDNAMIINEKFVKEIGITDDPLGRSYDIWGTSFTIIGVVKDYHFRDVREPIRPAMLFTRKNMGNNYDRALVKIYPGQTSEVIKHIKECYKKLAPGKTLDYSFWDEELGKRYESEERWSKIVGYAAAIAIIISSLGLFGLTILLINQRIKEIGVRKVNGATENQVLYIIIKSFVIWLFGAFLIGAPLANYIVYRWLENFPFKIKVDWWVFVMAGVFVLIIALLTVSWQSYRVAKKNPVEALRYE